MTRFLKISVVWVTMVAITLLSGCAGSGGGTVTNTGTPTDLTAVWAQMKVLNDMIIGLGIDQLKARVDALAANDVALKAALDKEIADAAARYANINSQITDINTQLVDVKTVLTSLQTQLNNIIANMATKADVANLQSQITSAVADITSNTNSIMLLQTQVAAIQVAITALQNHDVTTDAQIAALQASIASLQATIADLQAQIIALSGGMVKMTASAVGNGTITPTQQYWPKNVGGATFVVAPSAGNYFNGMTGTCPGTLSGYTFTTSATTLANCTLTATFSPSPVYYFESFFGSSGSGDGQYLDVRAMQTDSTGNIYVSDIGNSRITKLSPTGSFLLKFGSAGSADGQLSNPWGTAVDTSGNVYVIEQAGNRVSKFDSSGNFILKFGSFGSATGQFTSPTGIAVDSTGNILVLDSGNNRIQKFTPTGVYISNIDISADFPGSSAAVFAVDQNDNLYICNGNGPIKRYNSNGTFLNNIGTHSPVWPPTVNGSWYQMSAMAVKNNKVFVVESSRLEVFELGGNYITQFARPAGAYYNNGIAVDSLDNMFVYDNNVQTINKIIH